MSDPEERILFVDDEPNFLDGIRRHLHRRHRLEIALGGEEGLRVLRASGPFAVVVSDFRMPGMNGVEFLRHARELSPQSVRIMLTGQADYQATINAVNEGNIFRFLSKPCPEDVLETALGAALEQWRLVTAERVLLQRTLTGSVKVLTEILSLVHPEAFSRATRVRHYVEFMLATLGIQDRWQVLIAAMLCQIGLITLPASIIAKLQKGLPLNLEEKSMFHTHPSVGAGVLKEVPRLETVAEIVARQQDLVSPDTAALAPVERPTAILGGEILRIALAVEDYSSRGISEKIALQELAKQPDQYCEQIVAALRGVKPQAEVEKKLDRESIPVSALQAGMCLADEVRTTEGLLLVSAGQEVTEIVLQRLRNYARRNLIMGTVYVHMPPVQQGAE